jgi:hypothetical protein
MRLRIPSFELATVHVSAEIALIRYRLYKDVSILIRRASTLLSSLRNRAPSYNRQSSGELHERLKTPIPNDAKDSEATHAVLGRFLSGATKAAYDITLPHL